MFFPTISRNIHFDTKDEINQSFISSVDIMLIDNRFYKNLNLIKVFPFYTEPIKKGENYG